MGMNQGSPGAAHAAEAREQKSGHATVESTRSTSTPAGRLRRMLGEVGRRDLAERLQQEFANRAGGHSGA